MNIVKIAEVTSDNGSQLYDVVLRGSRWCCQCKAFIYEEDQVKNPCKHIVAVRTLKHVREGEVVQRRVRLTPKGKRVLQRHRARKGLPLVREPGWSPPNGREW